MFLNIFLKKNIHLGLRKISKFSRFSLDIANLDHHCSQTSNPMTKWLGSVSLFIYMKRNYNYYSIDYIPSPVTRRGAALQPSRFCD